MERRYLIATLALIATFAVFGRGLQSLQHFSQRGGTHVGMSNGAQCPFESPGITRWITKVRSHLHATNPEEAQLLAEMDLPFAAMQAKAAEQAAEQTARCARETAQRKALQAQRQALKVEERLARVQAEQSFSPMTFAFTMPAGLEQGIEARTAAVNARVSERVARLQVAADKWQNAATRVYVHSSSHSPCKTSSSRHSQRDVEQPREYTF